jgi:hypothetical protein
MMLLREFIRKFANLRYFIQELLLVVGERGGIVESDI